MVQSHSSCALLLLLIAVACFGPQVSQYTHSSSRGTPSSRHLSSLPGPPAQKPSGLLNAQAAVLTATSTTFHTGARKLLNINSASSAVRCPVKSCRVVPATTASCQCITLASYRSGPPVCCGPDGRPVRPGPPVPSTPYKGDKAALLLGLQQTPDLNNYLAYGWRQTDPLCEGPQNVTTFWTGIECADPVLKPGVVGKVLLPLSPFRGQLPAAWGSLLEPVEIDLSENFLTGPLPPEWGKLNKLKTLKLHWNRLTTWDPVATGLNGTISAAWANMTELQTLTLAGNDLWGTFPAAAFKSLSKLSYLTVDNNPKLSGDLPSSWRERPFMMSYTTGLNMITGLPQFQGPDNYSLGGLTLYTGSGPLWRTKIVNWEGVGNNSALNPDPQPNPNPCVTDPGSQLCV